MTAKIAAAARAAAACRTPRSIARQPAIGPGLDRGLLRRGVRGARPARARSRKGERDGVDGAHHRLLRRHGPRRRALPSRTAPVIGIGEAAFHMASLIAARFSVVTTLARSIPADRAQSA